MSSTDFYIRLLLVAVIIVIVMIVICACLGVKSRSYGEVPLRMLKLKRDVGQASPRPVKLQDGRKNKDKDKELRVSVRSQNTPLTGRRLNSSPHRKNRQVHSVAAEVYQMSSAPPPDFTGQASISRGVTINTQHISASPVVVPPYPVEPRHPTPHGAPPGPGFANSNPPYPMHVPHPVPQGPAAPYPPMVTPYPPAPGYPPAHGSYDYSAQPPPYHEAVAHAPVQPPMPGGTTNEGYSKQAPYNPHY